jgi:serine protease Do
MSNVVQFRRTTAILTLVAASLGGGLIAAFAVASHSASTPVFVSAKAASGVSGAVTGSLPGSFADVIGHVTPAVVNISSTRIIKASDQAQGNPFMADPFFRQFFGGNGRNFKPRDHKEGSLGSGVIVNSDGYILTNNHVVEKANEVKVSLLDKREFTAKVIGTDPQTDVAVLKIEAKDLPAITLGDSAHSQIGDLCFAIGNPFGVGQTVTMGIVSAKGRSLPRDGNTLFEDFIQTDAAINPGNSGGALINARGELIGINTAILTGGNSMMGGEGGNIGIGFAVPVNMAHQVMDQLVKSGKVTRGFMGARLQGITPELASQFGLKDSRGALVASVEPGKPAEKAGLKSGDVITAFNGVPVEDSNNLTLQVIQLSPGTTVTLDGVRDGKPMKWQVTLGTRPTDLEAQGRDDSSSQGDLEKGSAGALGLQVENMTPDIAQELQVPSSTKGAVVSGVEEGSPAAEAGLDRGDIIQQVNRQPVNNKADFDRLVRQGKDKSVLLLVNRGGRTLFLVVESK